MKMREKKKTLYLLDSITRNIKNANESFLIQAVASHTATETTDSSNDDYILFFFLSLYVTNKSGIALPFMVGH